MALPLLPLLCLLALALGAPLAAKDSLGVYANWAAFRDDSPARCYAIAQPNRAGDGAPFASIATWPSRGIRGQLHIRLSRPIREGSEVTLSIGERRFALVTKGSNAWASDTAMDAAVVAALRSATRMSVSGRAANGARFTDRYDLAGAATAIDAAVVGCAGRR
jgi:hypothetical protein